MYTNNNLNSDKKKYSEKCQSSNIFAGYSNIRKFNEGGHFMIMYEELKGESNNKIKQWDDNVQTTMDV